MPRSPTAQTPGRRMRGFEAASGLLATRIRVAGEHRGFAMTRLLTHWAEIAGDDLAKSTRPVKVSYAKGGMGATLTLLVRSAEAPMVQMQLPVLRDRVNACYGYNAISRISLTQTAPSGFADGQAEFTPAPVAEKPKADPVRMAAARETAADVQDEGLRAALESLAENILNRQKQ